MSKVVNRTAAFAALASLIAVGGANAADMAEPEKRIWSAEFEDGTMLQIVASKSMTGSNNLVIENIGMGGKSCSGPIMIENGEFATEDCDLSVSGKVQHSYRSWHSWDFKGMVSDMEFAIEDPKPAMVMEES